MPFFLFLTATAVLGGLVAAVSVGIARGGRVQFATWMLLASGLVFFASGVLLFAPQPVWVGGVLVAFGVARLVARKSRTIDGRS
jgi:hypothetical protein